MLSITLIAEYWATSVSIGSSSCRGFPPVCTFSHTESCLARNQSNRFNLAQNIVIFHYKWCLWTYNFFYMFLILEPETVKVSFLWLLQNKATSGKDHWIDVRTISWHGDHIHYNYFNTESICLTCSIEFFWLVTMFLTQPNFLPNRITGSPLIVYLCYGASQLWVTTWPGLT